MSSAVAAAMAARSGRESGTSEITRRRLTFTPITGAGFLPYATERQ
ncbi:MULTISPECIES: hypothetical protein [Streptomyces]|nr:hypothetical protein [Streptomyces sp. MCA2]MCL7492016.1 hypothetical protein [Streptomyces sp. MCA2]